VGLIDAATAWAPGREATAGEPLAFGAVTAAEAELEEPDFVTAGAAGFAATTGVAVGGVAAAGLADASLEAAAGLADAIAGATFGVVAAGLA
jgi:hypothetical protein